MIGEYMDKITFVLPSRNNLEFLKLAYQSLRNLKTKHQILVLDDASIDGTLEWLNSLNDDDLIIYSNPGPERIGIVGMFDKGIELSTTDIIFAFHADMVASPNLDTNILNHLKRGTVVSATRVEPPLHPPGPEKITLPLGNDVDEFDIEKTLEVLSEIEIQNENKITEGIFAPWCMYKDDFFAVGGHDELFAPQSKEDSDLFNRFHLMGYKFIQSWDALVYHFTSRGSRFNKHSGGSAGVNSNEWIDTTTKNGRNFIRKWGHFVKHDEYMKPIVPHKYDIAFIVNNCTDSILAQLEPYCSKIYCDTDLSLVDEYIKKEQPNTKYNLKDRIFEISMIRTSDIELKFDAKNLSSDNIRFIQYLPEIIDSNGIVEGKFEFDIFTLIVHRISYYEKLFLNRKK
jgi:glycosyltransferase involved in cell wall biosynthesis